MRKSGPFSSSRMSSFELHPFENDGFTYHEFMCRMDTYRTLAGAASDLSRLIRYVRDIDGFIEKTEDNGFIVYIRKRMMKQKLQIDELPLVPHESHKTYTIWDAFLAYQSELTIPTVHFRSDTGFQVFHGYKYRPVSNGIAEPFIEFARETICNGNERVFAYLMNWIAYLIQNPGRRPGTVIMLTAEDRAGRKTFCHTIGELFEGYLSKGSSDPRIITQEWCDWLENRILVVMNIWSTRMFNRFMRAGDRPTMTVNGPFMLTRTSDRVYNIMYIRNLYDQVMTDDSRCFQIRCSDARVNDKTYWNKLYEVIATDGFYEDLIYRFTNRDISSFDPRMTDGSYGLIDEFIDEHHDRLVVGVSLDELYSLYFDPSRDSCIKEPVPSDFERFRSMLARRLTFGGKPRLYRLKDDGD